MQIVLSFFIQMVGFYILYSTSARAVYAKRKLNRWLQQHLLYSKLAGGLLLTISFAMFMIELGGVVGFFVALTSVMTISGLIIILHPLKRDTTKESR